MTIEKTAWHYRIYAYWMRLSPTYGPAYKENLCHYVRVLLFWAPGTWITQWAERNKNWLKWAWGIAVGCYVGAFILAGLALLAYNYPVPFALAWASFLGLALTLFLPWASWRWSRGRKVIPQAIKDTTILVAAYVVARKRRICPFITFAEPGP